MPSCRLWSQLAVNAGQLAVRIRQTSTVNAQFTPPARHDKTVLSVVSGGVNWPPDKCVLRPSASGGRTAPLDTLRHRPHTERSCLAVRPTQFTPPQQTRQNSPVFVVSGVAMWISSQEFAASTSSSATWHVGDLTCYRRNELHLLTITAPSLDTSPKITTAPDGNLIGLHLLPTVTGPPEREARYNEGVGTQSLGKYCQKSLEGYCFAASCVRVKVYMVSNDGNKAVGLALIFDQGQFVFCVSVCKEVQRRPSRFSRL